MKKWSVVPSPRKFSDWLASTFAGDLLLPKLFHVLAFSEHRLPSTYSKKNPAHWSR